MEDKIIYKPYHAQGIFAYIIMAFILMEIVLLGVLISDFFTTKKAIVFLLVEGCGMMILVHFLILLSKVMIVFETNGLTVVNDRKTKYIFFEWNSIRYGYYAKSYKGHMFLVLSPDELSKEHVKKFVRKGANWSKVCVDNVVVIYLDGLKDISKITSIVERNVTIRNI